MPNPPTVDPDFRQPVWTDPVDDGLDWIRANYRFLMACAISGAPPVMPGWQTEVDISSNNTYARPDKWIVTKGTMKWEVRFTYGGSPLARDTIQICYDNGVDGNGLVCFAAASTGTYSLLNGLISWWSMNETGDGTVDRVDSHGPNDLSQAAFSPNLGDTTGVVGGGVDFNTGDYLEKFTSDFIMGDTDFTAAFWVKMDALGVSDAILMRSRSGSDGWEIEVNPDSSSPENNYIHWQIRNDSFSPITYEVLSPVIAVDTWYHVICYRDASEDEIGIHINGAAAITANAPNAPGNTAAIAVGGFGTDAKIDEAAVWNRLLSDAEKSALWNNGNGMSYPG
jgi:hypothetical protein